MELFNNGRHLFICQSEKAYQKWGYRTFSRLLFIDQEFQKLVFFLIEVDSNSSKMNHASTLVALCLNLQTFSLYEIKGVFKSVCIAVYTKLIFSQKI